MKQSDDLEIHIKDLRRLRDIAIATRKIGPAISAEVAIGRALVAASAGVVGAPRTVYDMSDDELLAIASRGKEVKRNGSRT